MNKPRYGKPNVSYVSTWFSDPNDKPMWALNLMKYRPIADYQDGRDLHISGADADMLYNPTGPLAEVGGRVMLVTDVLHQISGDQILWDRVAVAYYPKRLAMIEMQQLPSFIDLHAHVYTGVCGLSVPADETSSRSGVTTVISAGDAGANTIEGFRRLTVQASRTRVLAFLHVSNVGLAPWPAGESRDLDMLDVEAGIRAVRENPDIVLGVKVRMTEGSVVGDNGLEPLRRAVAIADATGLPLMMHIGFCPRPIGELLALLRPGDIVSVKVERADAYDLFGVAT